MFDISAIDTKTPSEKGAFMAILHPVTGETMHDDLGNEVGVYLVGRFSDAFAKARRENAASRIDAAAAQKPAPAEEDEVAHIVSSCTTGWTWSDLDGKPFMFSQSNARTFWFDPRFRLHLDLALAFITNLGNFMKR